MAEQRYRLDDNEITFNAWSPYFNSDAPFDKSSLKTCFWAQICELPPFLRTHDFLRETFLAFSEVLFVDDTDMYLSRLSGPRVRILTEDVKKLPQSILLPQLDEEGEMKYSLEYSGLHSQCSRCRSFEHKVQSCPIPKCPIMEKPRRTSGKERRGEQMTTLIRTAHETDTNTPRTQKFTWQPKRDPPISQPKTRLEGTQGYNTYTMDGRFWTALAPNSGFEGQAASAVIIPTFHRHSGGIIETLMTIDKSPFSFYLTQGRDEKTWAMKTAQTHLVNQIMLHLRKRIVLKHKHVNPIRTWEETSWIYHWTQPTPDKYLCIMVALVEYNPEICTMRSMSGLQWRKLPPTIQENISHQIRLGAQAWQVENTHLATF